MEQEDPIGKDVETSYSNPCRPQVAHVKPGFLSLPFNILALILNLLTSINFFPFASLCECPIQMLLSSQKSCRLPMLLPSLLPGLSSPNSHTQLSCLLSQGMHILFCVGFPKEKEHRPPPSG